MRCRARRRASSDSPRAVRCSRQCAPSPSSSSARYLRAAAFSDPGQPRTGPFLIDAKLAHAARGFFRNGGRACWVVRAAGIPGKAPVAGVVAGLRVLAGLDEPTAVAVPDAHALAGGEHGAAIVQRELVASCQRVAGRFALVDPPPGLDPEGALAWRARSRIDSPTAAAYYPWVEVSDPACGRRHLGARGRTGRAASRADRRGAARRRPAGHRRRGDAAAPAQPRRGQLPADVAGTGAAGLGGAYALGRPGAALPAPPADVGHLAASIAQGTRWALDEAADERLRERLRTTVTAFLSGWWRAGALHGDTPAQAFFVRCDSDSEDDGAHARGDIVLEIGLAVRRAGDFRVLRIAPRGDAPANEP